MKSNFKFGFIKYKHFEFIILLYKIMNVYNMLLLVVFNCIHVLVEVMITLIIFVTLIFSLKIGRAHV